MANNLTTYLADNLLDHLTGRVAYTKPTNTYAALFTVAPAQSGGGTEVAAANGYIRQQITWGAASARVISHTADIRFPAGVANASGNWGTVVAIGIFDALTSGNLLLFGTLSASVTVNSGDAFKLVTGALTVALS